MKKLTKNCLLIFYLLLAFTFTSYAQKVKDVSDAVDRANGELKHSILSNEVPFNVVYKKTLKGNMLQIGNGIVNRDGAFTNPNTPYHGSFNNNDFFNISYIDVDGDASTFSSSTANLVIPVATANCYKIAYAALYWSGQYSGRNVTDGIVTPANLNRIKFKMPGGTYSEILGTIIKSSVPTNNLTVNEGYYAAYADVTSLLVSLPNANGTYSVANVNAGSGSNAAGGWSLFVVYEDPLTSAKNITTFNGFSTIRGGESLDIPISGFTTIPVGPVRSKIAFASLEGDYDFQRDAFQINGTYISLSNRPSNNFFNSSINDINGVYTNRTPASTNTLGFDLGIFDVPNIGNTLLANNSSSATLTLSTGRDEYFYYFNAFSVDVIQPDINLIKTVRNLSNIDIANGNVTLGQQLFYDLEFQNIGNDNATNFTITDILPVNVDFIPSGLIVPAGVTYTFNPLTHTIVFTVPNSLVRKGGAKYKISIKVKVIEDCNKLRDACSNKVSNLAFKTYSSENSGAIVENGQPSASAISECLLLSPGSTNFLVGIDECKFTRDEILCGTAIVLNAASGYTNYQWHSGTPATAANLIPGATNQTLTVSAIGTYSVVNTAPATCVSITEVIKVVDFNSVITNPVIPYADEVVTCTNDGSTLPKIFLCGTGDSQLIESNILNATSIIWEKLNETSCPASTIVNCPNTNTSCLWTQVASGPNFNATTAGQYRIKLIFQNGCLKTYHFNVYQNLFSPTEVHQDIVCTTLGSITVNGVPAGFEFSLNPTGPWQTNNNFVITTQGNYTVYIKQISTGVGNCTFTIPNIPIRLRNFTTDVVATQPLCNANLGSIRVQVNDVLPQYTYKLFLNGTLINTVGPIAANDYTFPNLIGGNYRVEVTTTSGCSSIKNVTITTPALLTTTAAVTIPLACSAGEITAYPLGGTPPYLYEVSSVPGFQATPNFVISTAGTYTVKVTDFNNCTATTSIIVSALAPPVFTVVKKDILCYGTNSGEIRFNVTNTNGFTLSYSINGGNGYQTSPIFTNLAPGTYETMVKYSIGTTDCFTTKATIVINQPALALTASGGVSQLAGCGPMGQAEVRIVNPSGGVPPYQYSFDNGSNYGNLNTAFLAPGIHNLLIRDANLCVYTMPVTIDPVVTISANVSNPVFNCNGNSTSTVTVNNNGGNFSHIYLLDGVVNTNVPSNVFTNISCGNHVIKVQSTSLSTPTYSNLLKEDFGSGPNTTTPGISSAYCFNSQPYPAGLPCGNGGVNAGLTPSTCPIPTRVVADNQYSVTSDLNPNYCEWFDYADHTSNGTDPKGRFLAINIGSAAGPNGVLYSKTINSVIPNQPVIVDLWLANLIRAGLTGFSAPSFILELVDSSGNVIATQNAGAINNTVNAWQFRTVSLNPGANTNLVFKIRSGSTLYTGNDIAIDDIAVYQLPISCLNETVLPISIACGQEFKSQITSFSNVTCNGANNGSVTISAQNFNLPYGFDYSLNGSAWINSTTSPVTITGLAAGNHSVIVRYNNIAPVCSVSLTQVISQPNVLVASASLTTLPTCLAGGTITASATGGTPNYSYQLQNGAGAILVPYQSNPVFSNLLPGSYSVLVRDANSCIDPINSLITIVAASNPTATISNTSDLCYDTVNAASIIVNAANGLAPYQYNINGGIFQSSNTFSALLPGNYIVTVKDANNCTVTLASLTIAAQLTGTVSVTSNLNCTTLPNAVISGSVTGGVSPYTYQVSFNGGALGAVTPIVGTAFNFNTPNPGNYQFTIRDASGCTFVTPTVVVNPLPVLVAPLVSQINAIKCFGDANASISVTPSGGLAPYVINVLNTTNGINYGTQTSGLTAGNYVISVTDANSCVRTTNLSILQPNVLAFTTTSTNIQCAASGTLPGTINVLPPSGGTLPYTYTVSNSTGTFTEVYNAPLGGSHSFSILNFGIYTVTVVDANGCQLTISNTISSPPNSLIITPVVVGTSCATGGTIDVCVGASVTGGPYFFAIYQDLAPAVPGYPTYPSAAYQAADATGLCSRFSNLRPGVTYSFIVYDQGTNCYYFQTASSPVPTLSTMVATSPVVSNVTCTNASDGNVSFTVSGYSGTSISYQIFTSLNNVAVGPIGTTSSIISPSVTISNFGSLPPGQYYVLITENNGSNSGCSITTSNFTISQAPVLLSLVASVSKNDNCNVNAGQISVVGSNGMLPYSYQLVPAGSLAPTAITWAGQTSSVFNVEGGNYDVYIKDAFNCIKSVSVVLPTDTPPAITVTQLASSICNATEGNYTLVVSRNNSVGIAPFTYSIDGGAYTTYLEDATFSFLLNNLNSGSHTIIIKDANGCTSSNTIVLNAPLKLAAVPTISATTNCGVSDGVITVSGSGGSGSYSYSILPNSASILLTGNVFSNVPANNYTITITDLVTLCTSNTLVNLPIPAPVVFTTTVTDASCFSGSDGSIRVDLDATNTDLVYSYQIVSPIVVGPQSSNLFTNLAAGAYDVVVTSGRGCSVTRRINVGELSQILVPSPVLTQFNCNGGTNNTNFATITASGVTGGTSVYSKYEFILNGTIVQTGTSNVLTVSDLAGGNYTINVYDTNGCFGTATATINPFVAISNLNVQPINPITCTSNEDILITVSINGTPSPIFTYTVVGLGTNTYNVTQILPNFTGLSVGSYLVSVLNTVTGCKLETVYNVFNPNTFDTRIDLISNVTCTGASDGSVSVTFIDNNLVPTNDAGAFDYTVFNAANTIITNGTSPNAGPLNISTLAAGVYRLETTLASTPSCTVTKFFTISEAPIALSISPFVSPITCIATANDGEITVTAQDGWGGPYLYQLTKAATIVTPWSPVSIFTGLDAGSYTVSVKDISGCIVNSTIVLNVPTPISASISAINSNLLCLGDTNATINVTGVSGGLGNSYLYTLVNTITGAISAPQNASTFANLGAGTYEVIVTDSYSCSFTTASVVITEPSSVVTAQLATLSTATCNTQAKIVLTASGGTAPYRYSTTNNGVFIPFVGSVSFDVAAGTHQYFVLDANNCIVVASNEIVVEPVLPVSIAIDTNNSIINCNGGTTTVSSIATNGLGNYIYSLLPSVAGVIQTSPGVFANVPAGQYTVQVVSGDCSTTSLPFTISQPSSITYTSTFTNITCNGLNNGSINVIATGGTGTIQYSISSNPFQTVNSGLFSNLSPGSYTVSVQDQSGCFLAPLSFTITEPAAITLGTLNVNHELCINDKGSISFTLVGGTVTATQGYTVSVNNGALVQNSLTGVFNFNNLAAGTYDFAVVDAANCTSFQFQQIINPGIDINPSFDIVYTCAGNIPSNTVVFSVNPSIPMSEFTFSLDGTLPVSSNTVTGLTTGNHIMTINHNSGCSVSVPFIINAQTTPNLNLAVTGLNTFTASTTGGFGGYTYTVNGTDFGSTTVYPITATGDYVVTVTDSNGCMDTKTIFMTFYDVLIPDHFTPNGDGNNDGWRPYFTDNFPNLKVYIFDRYSRKIRTLGEKDSWDGTYLNNPLPSGDYWYVLKLNGEQDTREFIGNFTLYR